MSTSKKLKKSGGLHWTIKNVASNDSFTLPRGFRIRSMHSEIINTQSAANLILGLTAGTYATSTFTVTAPCGTSSDLTWGGGASGTVAVTSGDTAVQVAAKIAAAGAGASWTVTANGAVVTMVGVVPGVITAPTLAMGTTGVTISAITSVAGTSDNSAVNATAIGTTAQTVTGYTFQAGKDVNPATKTKKTTFTLAVNSATTGNILFNGTMVTLAAGDVDTAAHLATKLATINLPGYVVTANSNVVTVAALEEGTGHNFVKLELGTATGISWSTAQIDTDLTYYVNFSNTNPIGNINLYVMLEKLN